MKSLYLVGLLALTGCYEFGRVTPQEYEQAKVDCAMFGGLQDAKTARLSFTEKAQVWAECDGVRVIRNRQ